MLRYGIYIYIYCFYYHFSNVNSTLQLQRQYSLILTPPGVVGDMVTTLWHWLVHVDKHRRYPGSQWLLP